MNKNKRYPGIDIFRMAAALFIVANHTAPFEDISPGLDYLVTYCLGRVAVPFFLMVTGYFLLARFPGKSLKPYLCRLGVMYVAATLFYLPVSIYAGNLPADLGGWIKWFLMDGSFYHLWYLPAAFMGCLITAALLKLGNYWLGTIMVTLLYLIGLFGDSWYGAVEGLAPIEMFYQAAFSVGTYTRNGVFLAPIFLWLGAMLGKKDSTDEARAAVIKELSSENTEENQEIDGTKKSKGIRESEGTRQSEGNRESEGNQASKERDKVKYTLWLGIFLGVSLVLMMVEGSITKSILWQRHNSMYFMLPAVVVLLMTLLLKAGGKAKKSFPALSMWIYLIHPMCIVVIRGAAGALKLDWLFVENSLVFFLTVSLCSGTAAVCLNKCKQIIVKTLNKKRIKVQKGAGYVSKRKGMD